MVFIWKRFDPEIHHRQSYRLKGWDYTKPGLYFITLNSKGSIHLFGEIIDGNMICNNFGLILYDEWLKTPMIRPSVFLDEFIVMPDHFHGIIGIKKISGASLVGATGPVAPTTVPTIVTPTTITPTVTPTSSVWQRGFYDKIIWNAKHLENVRNYIRNNPGKWDCKK